MRNVFAGLMLALFATSACASSSPQRASAKEILASTKQLASKDCRRHYFGDGLYVARCSFSPAAFIDGKWGVIVHRVMVDKNGKFVGVMGTDTIYEFDQAGKFVDIIPGM